MEAAFREAGASFTTDHTRHFERDARYKPTK